MLPQESGTWTFACKNFPFEIVKKPQTGQFRVFIYYIMLHFFVFESQVVKKSKSERMFVLFEVLCYNKCIINTTGYM